jgi:hypothetical protein
MPPRRLAVDVSTLSRVDLNHRILNKIVEICATTSSMDGMGGMGMQYTRDFARALQCSYQNKMPHEQPQFFLSQLGI